MIGLIPLSIPLVQGQIHAPVNAYANYRLILLTQLFSIR